MKNRCVKRIFRNANNVLYLVYLVLLKIIILFFMKLSIGDSIDKSNLNFIIRILE